MNNPSIGKKNSKTFKRLSKQEIAKIYHAPLLDLVFQAAAVHRNIFPKWHTQKSRLFSIKTGSCSEDCKYCAQSAHYKTNLQKEKNISVSKIFSEAKRAVNEGAERFCMGAAWKAVKDGEEFDIIKEVLPEIKNMGLETCLTLGALTQTQANELKSAGLDYYNHNIDTSEEYYSQVVSTHSFQDRLRTIEKVRHAGIKVCCGGILGMGESDDDRISFIYSLANMDPPPESIPINKLVPIAGTPMANLREIDNLTIARTIATIRKVIPNSTIRLAAGRKSMNAEAQALCFMSGANSIFIGDKLLTTSNSNDDKKLFNNLGINQK